MCHLLTFFSERSFNWDLSRQKYLGPLSYVYIIYIIYIYIYIYILVIYLLYIYLFPLRKTFVAQGEENFAFSALEYFE